VCKDELGQSARPGRIGEIVERIRRRTFNYLSTNNLILQRNISPVAFGQVLDEFDRQKFGARLQTSMRGQTFERKSFRADVVPDDIKLTHRLSNTHEETYDAHGKIDFVCRHGLGSNATTNKKVVEVFVSQLAEVHFFSSGPSLSFNQTQENLIKNPRLNQQTIPRLVSPFEVVACFLAVLLVVH